MNKAILISIKPEWVAKILNGEKTIEIRKTMPKCDLPIDVYICCTKSNKFLLDLDCSRKWFCWDKKSHRYPFRHYDDFNEPFHGKVVAKFTLKEIRDYVAVDENDKPYWDFVNTDDLNYVTKNSCLTTRQIIDYVGDKNHCYGWFIEGLKVYDKPKELSEFWAYNKELHKRYVEEDRFCCHDATNEYGEALIDCGNACDNILNCYHCWEEWSGWCHRLTRPPQSWCYVDVESEEN